MVKGSDREQAASTLVSFLIAVGIFMLAFTILTFFFASLTAQTDTSNTALNARATRLVDTLVTEPGTPADWHLAPDSTTRLGLLEQGELNLLDLNKFNSTVYGNLSTSLSNEALDYPDARTGLGLETGDFHLRTEPSFASGSVTDVVNMSGYRLAYVGQYLTTVLPGDTEGTPSQNESGILDNLTITFTNTRHNKTLLTELYDSIGDKMNDSATYLRSVLLPRLGGLYYSYDLNLSVAGSANGYWHFVNNSVYGDTPGELTVPSGEHYVTSSNWVGGSTKWVYGVSENDWLVLPQVDLTNATSANLSFVHWSDAPAVAGIPLDYGQLLACDISTKDDSACSMATTTEWSVVLDKLYRNGSKTNWEATSVNVTPFAGKKIFFAFHWTSDALAANDKNGWFVDNVNISGWQSGYRSYYYNDFEYNITAYDALVIGSEVAQANINASSTEGLLRQSIKDWVFKGRQIYGFGGSSMSQQWLDPIYTGSIVTASGALFFDQSDLSHPLLIVPNELSYRDYSRSNQTYSVPGTTFTKVIVTTDAGTPPLLAVSNSGAVSNGTVLLGSYFPHTMGTAEAKNFLINALMYGRFRSLYLDYGPSVPRDQVVGSAQRIALIKQDTSSDAPTVEIRVIVYTWGGTV
ncbi:MAG: choice-of-anchor J domain-containing protein [Euryarchaeota archaeon]|nr:choice-of-anchor J domain-containing protein [Euryarchaeota archaeon]